MKKIINLLKYIKGGIMSVSKTSKVSLAFCALVIFLICFACKKSASDKSESSELQVGEATAAKREEQVDVNDASLQNREITDIKREEQIEANESLLYEKYLLPKKEGFQAISLPFSMREYVIDLDRDSHYLFYEPSEFLANYLISTGYGGEIYNCFILPIENKNLVLLMYSGGSDSECYLLMLLNSENVIEYKMIGKGGDDNFWFVINKDFTIDLYDTNDKYLKKLLIQGDKIIVTPKKAVQ
jgi:hypothetical protein